MPFWQAGLMVLVVVVLAVVILAQKDKRFGVKCPLCGGRMPQEAETCPHCGESMPWASPN